MTLKTSFSNKKEKKERSYGSFWKELKEDRKRRIWTIVLFSLLCFLMTAAFELELESILNRNIERTLTDIMDLTSSDMTWAYLLFAGMGASLFGFQGFFWLTKREQVDFYHSQPFKRERRFLTIYVNGVILFEVPMILHMVISGLLIGIRGYLTQEIIMGMLMNILIFTIAFLMMYHLVILSMMITGNIIVSFMVAGTIFVYPSVVSLLVEGFFTNYFDTYTSIYSNPVAWVGYISPIERVIRCVEFNFMGTIASKQLIINLLILGAMAILMFTAAFLLYKKRPSEAAGNALAFPKAGDFIRFLIVIPAGMFFGIMFTIFGVHMSVFWLYFGTIVGVILAHGFMEVIFHFDIKAALGKKVQLLISTVLVLGIVSVFSFDLFGYDTFIPKADQLKEVSYFINIGEMNTDYYILNENGVPVSVSGEENVVEMTETSVDMTYSAGKLYYSTGDQTIYREEYQMTHSTTENVELVLQLIQAYMGGKYQKETYGSDIEAEENTMAKYEIIPYDGQETERMIVAYKMNSGRMVYREYYIPVNLIEEYYGPIYETEEGKALIHPYMKLSSEEMKRVSIYAPHMMTEELNLTEDEIDELLHCYKKDLAEQTIGELLHTTYLGELNFIYELPANERGETEDMGLKIFVTDTYSHVLEFLKERNISLTLPNDNYEITNVVAYNPFDYQATQSNTFWKGKEQVVLTQEQMEEILPYLITDEYHGRYYTEDNEYYLNVSMTIRNKSNGTEKEVWYSIYSKNLPEEMRADQ